MTLNYTHEFSELVMNISVVWYFSGIIMSWYMNSWTDQVQFVVEIEPELELFLGIGLVRNEEYIGIYFNLTAWNITTQGIVQLTIDFLLQAAEAKTSWDGKEIQ